MESQSVSLNSGTILKTFTNVYIPYTISINSVRVLIETVCLSTHNIPFDYTLLSWRFGIRIVRCIAFLTL